MPQFSYGVPAGRINRLKGEFIGHAVTVEVLGLTGMQRKMPKNVGQTVVYRSYLPYGAATTNQNTQNRPAVSVTAHMLQEGVTPTADSLTPRDVTCTLQQFGVLYQLTDKAVDLHEDGADVPDEMKKQTGERMGLLREMIRWGVLKGCTNAFYQGGSSRAAVNGKVNASKLRKISRNLQSNHAKRITNILSATYDFGTTPVEASFLIYGHTDLENDFRDLPNFKHVSEYANRKTINENELGSWENFRIILTPELGSIIDVGAAVGSTGMISTGSTYIDVYPIVVVGENAWGSVALRGDDAVDPTYIPAGLKTKDDPLGQRGYVGASFWNNSVLLNQGWMAVYEVGATDL